MNVFTRDHAQSLLCPSAILDDNLLEDLSSYGSISSASVRKVLEARWPWWTRYGEELVSYLESIPRRPIAMQKNSRSRARQSTATVAATASSSKHVPKELDDLMTLGEGRLTIDIKNAGTTIVAALPDGANIPRAVTGFCHYVFDDNARSTVYNAGL